MQNGFVMNNTVMSKFTNAFEFRTIRHKTQNINGKNVPSTS